MTQPARNPGLYLLSLLGGPLLALPFFLGWISLGAEPSAAYMAGITLWVAMWWFTEPVHLGVTAFLPFILIPLFGIAKPKEVASEYMDPIIFLFIGGFILAFAMEKWNLHKRIALTILKKTGSAPSRILFGVMLTGFVISMWVSNTATAMMLISAILSIVLQMEESGGKPDRFLATGLLLGMAYSTTMGGMSTLVGTPPNMFFYSFFQKQFPGDLSLNFASWMLYALPITICLTAITYAVIWFLWIKKSARINFSDSYFSEAYALLGRVKREEWTVMAVFFTTVILWFTRADLPLGSFYFKGWASRLGLQSFANDGMVAVTAALALFLIPSGNRGERVLEWKDVKKLPFDIILLFGSGFALAYGFEHSGLADWLGTQLERVTHLPMIPLLLLTGIIITIVSEFASNIACVQLVLPLLASVFHNQESALLSILVGATLFSSLGFMMPVATPPNTIVFGTERIRVKDMMRTGLWVNLAGIVLITLFTYFFLLGA